MAQLWSKSPGHLHISMNISIRKRFIAFTFEFTNYVLNTYYVILVLASYLKDVQIQVQVILFEL